MTRSSKSSKRRRGGRLRVWLVALVAIAAVAIAAFFVVRLEYDRFISSPLELGGREMIIQIPRGSSASYVVDKLASDGVVSHRFMLRYMLRRSGAAGRIQPGYVLLTPGMTPMDLPDLLARTGRFGRKSVQINAGMNIYDVASRLQESGLADGREFIKMALDPAYAAGTGIPAGGFEGYIGAGSYTFEPGTDTPTILSTMHRRWREQWKSVVEENMGRYESSVARGMGDDALMVLASIVEKESSRPDERAVIARVFLNRLRAGMKLQSDPTCVYPPKYNGEKPTPERCHDQANKYSTYVAEGLPPGPISTPSVSSMRAVLRPYTGPDYSVMLYFVAKRDGSGTHYFSRTYTEHRTAVEYFLKGRGKPPHGTTQP